MRLRETLLEWCLRALYAFDRRAPDASELGSGAIRTLLVISSTAIGDTLMSTPAIASLRKAYPHARIVLLVHTAYRGLFGALPEVNATIPYRGGWKGFVGLTFELRRERPDMAVILHGNEPQATPLAYLSGARWRFKLPARHRLAHLLSHPAEAAGADFAQCHVIEKRLRIALLAGGVKNEARMALPMDAETQRQADAWLAAQPGRRARMVALQLGASEPHRCWPAERFAELAKRLLRAPDLCLLLTGSPAERADCNALVAAVGDTRVLNAAGALPLPALPALLKRAHCLVSGDTGTMHIAVAIQTPVIALFGSADHRITGPYQDPELHTMIQKWQTCTPCVGSKCPYRPATCMQLITVDEVEHAVTARLGQTVNT